MTEQQYLIKRKLNVVDFADQMKNISEACRRLGVSRQHYYDIRNTLAEEGVEGLMEKSRKIARPGNRFTSDIEDAILAYSLQFPTHGQQRAANELNHKQGWQISAGGIRSVWLRHQLESKALRLKRLEKWAKENYGLLTESQIKAMEEQKEEKQAHGEIETHHSGFLVAQDSYYVGYIKGIGKIYQQTGIDTYSNVGFTKLYTDKTSMVAAEFLNSKILPFFDEQGISVLRVLTDRGTEYCGRPETHHYQLFLYLNQIEHSKTKARHPQTNGSCEKLNQTVQEEFYSVAFRKKLYTTIEEMQKDLDDYMNYYNRERTNQGKRCQGRTPMETFLEGKELYKQLVFEGGKEKGVPIRRWEPEVETGFLQ